MPNATPLLSCESKKGGGFCRTAPAEKRARIINDLYFQFCEQVQPYKKNRTLAHSKSLITIEENDIGYLFQGC